MRFSTHLLMVTTAVLSAGAAWAQQSGAPDEAAVEAAAEQDTTQGRLDEEESAETPVEGEPADPTPPSAEAAAPEPAAAEAATAAPADAPSPPAPPLTRAQIAQIERAAERGRQLIAIARAGIVATQDMLSRVSDPAGAGIAGWIAEPEGNAMKVTFYAERGEGGQPRAVFRANVLGGRVVSRDVFLGEDRPPLTPIAARMAAARGAVTGLDHRPCDNGTFNYLMIPPASASAPIDVYQVTAPAQRGHFPLGGHFRATVAANGTVSGARSFANGCVDLEAPPTPEGEQPRPIGVTHLLDPMPTEMHLFLSQLMGRPLLVATGEPQRTWLVTPERIAEVRP